jgi:curved DNA-binding protein CbpA
MVEGDGYYEILGVAQGASLKVINQAYKKLALKYHPDKTGGRKSHELRFQQVCRMLEALHIYIPFAP